jgi:hypothetical protein
MKSFRIRSLFSLLAAGVVAAGVLAVEPADAAKRTAKSAKADKKATKAAKSESGHRTYAQYEKDATVYWQSVVDMRRVRIAKRNRGEPIELTDYVLAQPPHWPGAMPRRPLPPATPGVPRLPLVSHMLTMAAEQHGFVPQRPASDLDFKRAYASAATAAGITAQQAVRIYAFETGGNGTYDVQAGLTHPKKGSKPISPAVGYNQLLSTNTIGLLAANGEQFVTLLKQRAAALEGDARKSLERKLEALERMIAHTKTVPYAWAAHDKMAKFTRQGYGIHAAIFDRDIGPLLQTQKLLDSVQFAKRNGKSEPLTAAELELMNFTGDGNGFDMVTMPLEFRDKVPTSNFFQPRGYSRNPIAKRTGTVAGLIASIDAKMDRASKLPGAQELAEAFREAAATRQARQ